MSWLASLGVGILTAIFSLVGTFFLALCWVDWARVSSREGHSSYLAAFLGLVGGVVGLIIGIICARVVAAGATPGFLKGLLVSWGVVLGLLAIITLVCWLVADLPPKVHGHAVRLQVEVRLPASWTKLEATGSSPWYARIDTRAGDVMAATNLDLKAARQEAGQWIVPVAVAVTTSAREKLLHVLVDKFDAVFPLTFNPQDDAHYREWSAWQEGAWVGEAPAAAPLFSTRFRLEEVIPEPAPDPAVEEIQRNAAVTAEEAALNALTPESPWEETMKFTHYTQGEERRHKAGAVLARRPEVVEELGREIVADNGDVADRALRAVPFLQPIPPGLAAPVGRVGDALVVRLQRVVATPVAEDPRFQGAADFSVRFAGWFDAHRALHEAGIIDGRPQLEKFLALARQREDSHVLKEDVVRIATHYLKEWNAAAPTRP